MESLCGSPQPGRKNDEKRRGRTLDGRCGLLQSRVYNSTVVVVTGTASLTGLMTWTVGGNLEAIQLFQVRIDGLMGRPRFGMQVPRLRSPRSPWSHRNKRWKGFTAKSLSAATTACNKVGHHHLWPSSMEYPNQYSTYDGETCFIFSDFISMPATQNPAG